MEILSSSDQDLEKAAAALAAGLLVAFPTETVYGLGADAFNISALARIFEAKNRPRFDPLIVHIAERDDLSRIIDTASLDSSAKEHLSILSEQLWPGPLTLILPKRPELPGLATAGLSTAAVRFPSHPVAQKLIRLSTGAVAAPSANPFGYVSPTEAGHVAEQLGDIVDLIIDGGPSAVGVESTILSFEASGPVVLRVGGTPVEALQSVLGRIGVQIETVSRPSVPGQMKRHYSTRTPLEIIELSESITIGSKEERIGLLTLSLMEDASRYAAVEILSSSGDLREAAAGLFRALRRLDALSLDRIVARPFPEKELGLAIMDRLRRCAARE